MIDCPSLTKEKAIVFVPDAINAAGRFPRITVPFIRKSVDALVLVTITSNSNELDVVVQLAVDSV